MENFSQPCLKRKKRPRLADWIKGYRALRTSQLHIEEHILKTASFMQHAETLCEVKAPVKKVKPRPKLNAKTNAGGACCLSWDGDALGW